MAGAIGLGIAVVGLISGNKSARAAQTQTNTNLEAQYRSEYNTASANLATAKANSAATKAYAADLRAVAYNQQAISADIIASGEQAYQLALSNAGLIREEGAEDARRQGLVHEDQEGLILARQGASGIKVSSKSSKLYYKDAVDSNQAVINWMNKATESKAMLEQERGIYERTLANISAQQYNTQANLTLAQANNAVAMANAGVTGAEAAFAGLTAPSSPASAPSAAPSAPAPEFDQYYNRIGGTDK